MPVPGGSPMFVRFDAIVTSIRRAAAGLRRSPGFAVSVVASVALGVGVNTAVFALLRHALLRPLPYPAANELVSIGTAFGDGLAWTTNGRDLIDFKLSSRTLTGIGWTRSEPGTYVGEDRSERVNGARASSNLIDVLRIRPRFGRWFTSEEETRDEAVVVLSEELWRRRFGDDSGAVGRSIIKLDGRARTVIGVMESGAILPAGAQFWYSGLDNGTVQAVARVRPGVPTAEVERELNSLSSMVLSARSLGLAQRTVVTSLHERLYGPNGPSLRLLLGTVVLLLLLACTNVANLSLVRTLERGRELAVCVALGASPRRLAFQILAENALLGLAGLAVGMVFALWATALLARLSPAELPGVRGAAVGIGDIAYAAIVAMVVSAAVSIAPTLAITRGDLRRSIGQTGALGATRASGRTRRALAAAQLGIALLLVTGTGLLVRSMIRLTSIDTGFDRHGLVVLRLPLFDARYRSSLGRRELIERVAGDIRSVPGVRAVSVGPPPLVGKSGHSMTEGFSNAFSFRDSSKIGAPSVNVWVKHVDAHYLQTFRIALLAGRGIRATDDAGAPAVGLMNAAAARLFFPDGVVLGRIIEGLRPTVTANLSGGRPIAIVGLLPDVRQRDITIAASAEIWLPSAQQNEQDSYVYITARTDGAAEALVGTVRRIVARADPDLRPATLSSMDAIVRRTLAPQRFVLFAIGAVSAVALTLAALGLYSVMAYITSTRTREIGVRMALGARASQIRWMILSDSLRVVSVGAVVGLVVAYASSRVMSRFLFEVGARDPLTFVVAPVILTVCALVAAYLPARRATLVDPVRALRAE